MKQRICRAGQYGNGEVTSFFFKEGMACSEGSERERYTNIVLALEAGEKETTDGE